MDPTERLRRALSDRYRMNRQRPVTPAVAVILVAAAIVASLAAFTGQVKHERWAVVIGISDYKDPQIPDLKYADKDAEAVYKFLRSPEAGMGGIPADHIRLLLDDSATNDNVHLALLTFLRNSTDNDVIFVYIAGQGVPDPLRPQNAYLLTYDTQSSDLSNTAVPIDEAGRALGNTHAYNRVVIVDATHSGPIAPGKTRRVNLNPTNQVFLDRFKSSGGGLVTFTASGRDQLSQAGPQWGGGHGVFTYYLLQGLEGAADANHDHIVTLGEVMEYTRQSVMRATRTAQVPAISNTSYDRAWPMAIVTKDEQTPGPGVPRRN